MTFFAVSLGVVVVLLTSSGQILLKMGARGDGDFILNGFVISGYSFFVCVMFLSAVLMKEIDFKYFTVIVALNYLGATLMAIAFLKETFTVKKMTGCVLITLGAILFPL